MYEVQSISCANNGGFTLWFDVHEKDGLASEGTKAYPIGQHRTVDLSQELGWVKGKEHHFKEGMEVWPYLYCVLGQTLEGPHFIYRRNGKTAQLSVSGTTIDASVTLNGISP